MTIGDLARVNVLYVDSAHGGSTQENVFGFKAISAGATLANLGSAFQTAMIKNTSGGLLFQMNNNLSTTALTVRDVLPGTQAEAEVDYAAVTGSIAGEGLPPQCATIISWRTGLAGRSFRGRTYLPGVSESSQREGLLSAGAITNYQTIVTQMLAVFGPAGSNTNWQFCIISEVSAGAPRVPKIGTPVTAGLLDPDIQTQRRRNN